MSGRITIFGYGPVGRATAERLSVAGREALVAQRSKPAALPKGAAFVTADALDRESVLSATRGSAEIVVAIGFPYEGRLWRELWPKTIGNFVAACEATGARMVFVD
ncbi:MAG: epimerase, partial [Hyphomicrobiales bacterium]|nr:epimerase [Hyphomicrobiales bacterium]